MDWVRLKSEAEKVGDLRNFKIQDYQSNSLNYLSKSAKYAGYGTSAYSLGLSIIEYSDCKIPISILLMDIGMTGASYSGSYGTGISAFYFMGVRNTPDYFKHKVIDLNEHREVKVDKTRVSINEKTKYAFYN